MNFARHDKILGSANELRNSALVPKDAQVVLCQGVFDVLHPGHLAHLFEAKTYGTHLVVSVAHDDDVKKGPGRPLFTQHVRMEQLAALEAVDFVVPSSRGNAADNIRTIRPNIFARGPDYPQGPNPELEAVTEVSAELRRTSAPTDSSTRVSSRAFQTYARDTEAWLDEFSARFPKENVLEAIRALKDARVLLIGERRALQLLEPSEVIETGARECKRWLAELSPALIVASPSELIPAYSSARHADTPGFFASTKVALNNNASEQPNEFETLVLESIGHSDCVVVLNSSPHILTDRIATALRDSHVFTAAAVDRATWLRAAEANLKLAILQEDLPFAAYSTLGSLDLVSLQHFPTVYYTSNNESEGAIPSLVASLAWISDAKEVTALVCAALKSKGYSLELSAFIGAAAGTVVCAKSEDSPHIINETEFNKFISRVLS